MNKKIWKLHCLSLFYQTLNLHKGLLLTYKSNY